MKKIISIMVSIMLVISLNANAQSGDKKEKELKSKQLKERSRSLGGQRTQSDIPGDKSTADENTQAADTVSSADNDSGNNAVVERNEDQPGRPAKGTAPAVVQKTTSESGSPSVLSDDNGEGRDGTNNVQRAKPNIAGAEEPGNMNLSKKNAGEKNIKVDSKIQRQEERPQATRSGKESESVSDRPVKDKSDIDSPNATDKVSKSGDDLSRKEKRQERRRNRKNKDNNAGM
jgi:hypothetical protein